MVDTPPPPCKLSNGTIEIPLRMIEIPFPFRKGKEYYVFYFEHNFYN